MFTIFKFLGQRTVNSFYSLVIKWRREKGWKWVGNHPINISFINLYVIQSVQSFNYYCSNTTLNSDSLNRVKLEALYWFSTERLLPPSFPPPSSGHLRVSRSTETPFPVSAHARPTSTPRLVRFRFHFSGRVASFPHHALYPLTGPCFCVLHPVV